MTNFANLLRAALLILCLVALSPAAPPSFAQLATPLSPAESLARFQLDEGLAIELVACEPEVIDPIAIRFDEAGRLWVVEMRDYPHGPAAGEPPRSQIRVLTDEDGDGRFETARVFADGLLFPTGIQPWKGGLFVTLAGEVAYLQDTDGDGRADARETWFRGFAQENPQLRANHPRLALDGRIYISNGLRGGDVVDARRAADAAKPLSISGRDFSFDPRTGDFAAVSGNGQFGVTFDDFGNRFTCNNRAPLEHVVLPDKYLARNPFFAAGAVVQDVAAPGELSKVFPLTAAWTTSNLHAGQFTAAFGVEIYRGDALGADYYGNAFTCEPTGSLVHREILRPNGASFVSRAAQEGREFLASSDSWFRPVNLEIGPDGSLYVVDMYRAVIEHPQYMPSELQQRPDLRLGDDRGRIYRITKAGAKQPAARPNLRGDSTARLVELLEHPNAWWRETAARLLLEAADPAAKPALQALAASAATAPARVQALWLLENLRLLEAATLTSALADDDPRVRAAAVVLAERRLAANNELRSAIIAAAVDDNPGVRFHGALVLGGMAGEDVSTALAQIALARPDDPWTRAAVSTALPEHLGPIVATLLRSPSLESQAHDAPAVSLLREMATTLGASRDAAQIGSILKLVGNSPSGASPASEAALAGLASGLERRGSTLSEVMAGLPDADKLNATVDKLLAHVVDEVADESLAEDVRAAKIALLKYSSSPRSADVLLEIVSQSPSQALRIASAEALAGQPADNVGTRLIEAYASQTPGVRSAILDTLIARPASAARLLDELESRRIARAELGTDREKRLTSHGDAAVRQRAAKILTNVPPADRKRVLDDYQSALELASDPAAGKPLFRKHCATCHHIGDLGVDVAPDISDSRVKTPQQLLVDILSPNQAIDNNYTSYSVVTHDGQVHTGIIAAETATSISLRQAENKTVDVLRADVEAVRSNGVSLMPEGFEKELSKQQLADLISFVKNWRYLEQPIPGTLQGPK